MKFEKGNKFGKGRIPLSEQQKHWASLEYWIKKIQKDLPKMKDADARVRAYLKILDILTGELKVKPEKQSAPSSKSKADLLDALENDSVGSEATPPTTPFPKDSTHPNPSPAPAIEPEIKG